MHLDEKGYEIHTEGPLSIPVGLNRPPSIAEQVARLVRTHLSSLAQSQGQESFEEADDFEVGDDYDPRSPHELERDQELEPPFTQERLAQEFAAFLKTRTSQPQAGAGVNGDPPQGGGVPGAPSPVPPAGRPPA